MRIDNVNTKQFAGLLKKDIDFNPGLNLIIGKNEAGKSTIVDLMYQLLFQQSKLSGTTDKEFIRQYTPNKIDVAGTAIRGEITFTTDKGTYVLEKKWGKTKSSVDLTLPNGSIEDDEDKVTEILIEELGFRKGVYDQLVFASQKRGQDIIPYILGANLSNKSTTSQDLTSLLNDAVLESGGVSISKLEAQIQHEILKYNERWDSILDMPEGGAKRGINHPWSVASSEKALSNQQAIILKAYYDKEILANRIDKAKKSEERINTLNSRIKELSDTKSNLHLQQTNFAKYSGLLEKASLLNQEETRLNNDLNVYHTVNKNWPVYLETQSKLSKLIHQSDQVKIRNQYLQCKEMHDCIVDLKAKLSSLKEVDIEDVNTWKASEQALVKYNAQLSCLNLVAQIHQLSDVAVEIRTLKDNRLIETMNDQVSITEPVKVIVPGIVEMTLSSGDIDAESINKSINALTVVIAEIKEKYNVEDIDTLSNLSNDRAQLLQELENVQTKLTLYLNGVSYEALEKSYHELDSDISALDINHINNEIGDICGNNDPSAYLGKIEGMVNQYTDTYESISHLDTLIDHTNKQMLKLNEEKQSIQTIPEAYLSITDPTEYMSQIDNKLNHVEASLNDTRNDLVDAQVEADDETVEELEDQYEDAVEIFENKKKEYQHLLHIQTVFNEKKAQLKGNPCEDIEKHFKEYLTIISDGQIQLESLGEKLESSIVSGTNKLEADNLSNGTKETIALAFRLAMLNHIYPNGNGLAIFDDPFTNMDPERTKQACNLIKKYAENNQVIFTTCDNKYETLLGGNIIMF